MIEYLDEKAQAIEQAKATILAAKSVKTPNLSDIVKRIEAIETILGI
jgi:hypothetical protein